MRERSRVERAFEPRRDAVVGRVVRTPAAWRRHRAASQLDDDLLPRFRGVDDLARIRLIEREIAGLQSLVVARDGGNRSLAGVMNANPRQQGLWLLQGAGFRPRRLVRRRRGGGGSLHPLVRAVDPAPEDALTQAIRERGLRSVSAVFRELAGGVEDAASKPALASLLDMLWASEYEDERDARFINDRVHGNIQKDSTFSVVPEMAGGICTSAELQRIADVAVKYAVPLVKLTGGQRIDLVGVRKEDLPGVWRDLGMPAGHAWARATAPAKAASASTIAASAWATAWAWRSGSSAASAACRTARAS